jgi:hypothetical protein
MSVSSLTRFTVPLTETSFQGILMPKLKYRFRVNFENFGISKPSSELTKQVMDFTRPQVTFGDMTIDVYNSKIKLAGKPEWGDVTVNFRDDALGSVSKLVGEQIQKQFDFMEQSSAASGIDYKFITRCEVLDGGNGAISPVVLETWELYGCYVSAVNYNELNYATSEPATIQMTLKFDNAVQTPLGTGIGATLTSSAAERVINRISNGAATG